MSQSEAVSILNGILPMPENMTVEAVFSTAHITPSIPTPF